ncbi:MAG: TlpA disulfide reductase family protein, partial [Lawsonibacter sp.]
TGQGNAGTDAPPASSQGDEGGASQSGEPSEEIPEVPAPDFTLVDQNGETHTLSDYQGKTVFLNFWATWCGPCQNEMPEIQALYEKYGSNGGELVVLGVANPKSEDYPYNQDNKTQAEVEQFLREKGYTFPVVMDTTGEVFSAYGISAFPTTFMIDAEGNLFGYVVSQMTGEMMESIVQQTMTGQRVS